MEQWKQVFDGVYEVSNTGRVRRLKAGKGTTVGREVKVSLHQSNRGGVYGRVSLWNKNRKVDAYVHRLVAEAFLGPCPRGQEVNHKNGNSTDNRIENLEYLTHTQNNQHYHLLNRGLITGENHWNARLKEVDVKAIKVLTGAGFPQQYVADLFDVGQSAVEKIVLGLRWTDVEV